MSNNRGRCKRDRRGRPHPVRVKVPLGIRFLSGGAKRMTLEGLAALTERWRFWEQRFGQRATM